MDNLVVITPTQLVLLLERTLDRFMMKSNSSKPVSQGKVWLNSTEAAAYLKVPISTIYQLTHHKKIPFSRINRILRFSKDSLDFWLEEKVQPEAKNSFINNKKTQQS
jgi:excisionase family DNA binding protein